ncbi:hypothetical protein GCM10010531_41540 [Blastococcus jejuensis]|uniref:Uncharacterized protein n=1 Tax=Blastococcus jejuensis TaxID=351224 RepID=A0ABP6PPB3_9ACTN
MGIGRRASQPAKEKARAPGTAEKIWTYGLKTVRGDTVLSRFLATGECGESPAGLSGGSDDRSNGRRPDHPLLSFGALHSGCDHQLAARPMGAPR